MRRIVALSALFTFLVFAFYSFEGFSIIDNRINDYLIRHTKADTEVSPVIIVAIDDLSRQAIPTWPWPTDVYNTLLQVLRDGHAKVIAMDVNMDLYSDYQDQKDPFMTEQAKAAGNIILSQEIKQIKKHAMFAYPSNQLKSSVSLGVIRQFYDSDLFIRRTDLIAKVGDRVYPSFALGAATKYMGMDLEQSTIVLANKMLILGDLAIPLDKESKMVINYRNERFPEIPFAKVLAPGFLTYNPDIFDGKIVLVGTTATELVDSFATSISKKLSGPQLQANIINTIISGSFPKNIPHISYLPLILLLTLLAAYISQRKSPVANVISFIGLTSLCILSGIIGFHSGWIINITAPCIALFGTFFVGILIRFITGEIERRDIRHLFNQYVSPTVVKELLGNRTEYKIPMVKKEASVLFIDIRGFTAYSATHDPELVVSQVNEFLNAMTNVITAYGGTIDKYIGDSIMAVWGSPLPQPDHALLAVKSALEQLVAIKELQVKWKKLGKPILDVGIGICSGEVVAGTIGAEKHKEYTVVGNTVNLAAKIQEYTREVSAKRGAICHFIISDSTQKLVNEAVRTRFLGEIRISNDPAPTAIWEVLGLKS
jgi:adenylate cyclase